MLPIFSGISSALSWGAADFFGGLASKSTSPYRVLFLAELAGLVPAVALAAIAGEPIPAATDLILAAMASLLGLSGLVILYRALAAGQMSIAAPVSALLAAVSPVIFGLFSIGLPTTGTALGFAVAFLSVWFISQADTSPTWRLSWGPLRGPLLAGLFFGLYFIMMHSATMDAFFWPLVSARLAGCLAVGLMALRSREPVMPPRNLWGICLLTGALDMLGSALYVLAAQTGRMDVAAVLGAMYPASTILLAWIVLKERITTVQSVGVLLAFAAILLFTI